MNDAEFFECTKRKNSCFDTAENATVLKKSSANS